MDICLTEEEILTRISQRKIPEMQYLQQYIQERNMQIAEVSVQTENCEQNLLPLLLERQKTEYLVEQLKQKDSLIYKIATSLKQNFSSMISFQIKIDDCCRKLGNQLKQLKRKTNIAQQDRVILSKQIRELTSENQECVSIKAQNKSLSLQNQFIQDSYQRIAAQQLLLKQNSVASSALQSQLTEYFQELIAKDAAITDLKNQLELCKQTNSSSLRALSQQQQKIERQQDQAKEQDESCKLQIDQLNQELARKSEKNVQLKSQLKDAADKLVRCGRQRATLNDIVRLIPKQITYFGSLEMIEDKLNQLQKRTARVESKVNDLEYEVRLRKRVAKAYQVAKTQDELEIAQLKKQITKYQAGLDSIVDRSQQIAVLKQQFTQQKLDIDRLLEENKTLRKKVQKTDLLVEKNKIACEKLDNVRQLVQLLVKQKVSQQHQIKQSEEACDLQAKLIEKLQASVDIMATDAENNHGFTVIQDDNAVFALQDKLQLQSQVISKLVKQNDSLTKEFNVLQLKLSRAQRDLLQDTVQKLDIERSNYVASQALTHLNAQGHRDEAVIQENLNMIFHVSKVRLDYQLLRLVIQGISDAIADSNITFQLSVAKISLRSEQKTLANADSLF